MKCVMLDRPEWMDGLKAKAAEAGLTCVALPMPTGVDFKHTFDYEIPTPLSPLDWYALIKYASAYIGENMHPVVVALHNASLRIVSILTARSGLPAWWSMKSRARSMTSWTYSECLTTESML